MSQCQLDSELPGSSCASEHSESSSNNPPPPTPLISPDSQNNNRRNPDHPCLVSPEKELRITVESSKEERVENPPLIIDDSERRSDARNFQGRILYTGDGSAYIIEGDESNLPPKSLPISADSVSENSEDGNSLVSAYHVRPNLLPTGGGGFSEESCEPLIQRYKVFNRKEACCLQTTQQHNHSIPASDNRRILICFLCKLSFSQCASFEAHITGDHLVELSKKEKEVLLQATASSAILQKGPLLSFLKPVEEEEEEEVEEDLETEKEKKSEISPEEIARNLMLASELSASRLLQQVSQNAFAMASSGAYVPASISESLMGCAVHPEGKSANTDCSKCDILLSTKPPNQPPTQLSIMHTAAAARNSCKTLKCPKCNWHYKYQETLEIHMKEKHPDSEVSCGYCLHNQPHPKLARGETYGCGYKPYRCEICKYSTTTKGNLSIHMQSDKHLNNVQELTQGGSLIDPASLIHSHPPQHPTTSTPRSSVAQLSPATSEPSKSGPRPPSGPNGGEKLRCDVCNYETTVARNLRIHMTSEKHTQNTMLLQRKLALCGGAPYVLGAEVQQFGFNPMVGLDTASLLGLQRAEGLVPEEQATSVYQCCVCVRYCTDSLEELLGHIQADRSVPGPADVTVLGGSFFCNLCQYKTHLKANFQLHTKTDKHVQRLMLVNHVREGGAENEWRLRYVNVNNPVQLKCNACNEIFTSSHKLQLHVLTSRHNGFQKAFFLLKDAQPNQRFICTLCNYTSRRTSMSDHLHSTRHRDALNSVEDEESKSPNDPDQSGWIRSLPITEENEDEEYNSEFVSADLDEESEEDWNLEDDEENMTDAIHCCAWCNYTCKTSVALRDHVKSQHGDGENEPNPVKSCGGKVPSFPCRLCQVDAKVSFCHRQQLEDHLFKVHKVSEEAIGNVLPNLPSDPSHTPSPVSSPTATVPADSTTVVDSDLELDSGASDLNVGGNLTFPCSVCLVPFNSCEDLYSHQSESGHLELKQTPNGPGYLCWQKGCNQYFKTVAAVQVHFREIHAKKSHLLAGCISDRHVYKYRCSQCSLAFRTEQKLQEHSIYHLMRASTKCAICGKNFRKIDSLRRHVESKHINENSGHLPTDRSRPQSLQPSDGVSGDVGLAEEQQKDTSGRQSANSLTDEDHLNTPGLAEMGYNEPGRKFKCIKCKLGFTRQSYLAAHQKTMNHRRGDKINYSMEKFLDPNRPFKCDICKESFTQKNILLVHFNSVSHLHKMKKMLEQQQPDLNLSPQELATLNRGRQTFMMANTNGTTAAGVQNNLASSSSQSVKPLKIEATATPKNTASGKIQTSTTICNTKPYRCNICKVAYNQGSTLDIHLRSVAHQSRASKVSELAAAGEIDVNLPPVEQPESAATLGLSGEKSGTKQLISEMIAKKHQHQHQHQLQQAESAAMLMNMMSAAQFPAFLLQAFQNQKLFGLFPCPTCSSVFNSEADLKSHQNCGCGKTSSTGRKGTPVKREVATTPDTTNLTNGVTSSAQEGISENPGSPPPCNTEEALVHSSGNRSLAANNFQKGLGVPKGGTFRKLLENYGFEVVMQYNEMIQQRKRKHLEEKQLEFAEENLDNVVAIKQPKLEIPDSFEDKKLEIVVDEVETKPEIPEMTKGTCSECGKTFSSIWVLKAHFEQVHQALPVPSEALEEVSEQFKNAYEKKCKESGESVVVSSASDQESSENSVASTVSSVISQVTNRTSTTSVVSQPESTTPPAPSATTSNPIQQNITSVSQAANAMLSSSLPSQIPLPSAFVPGFPFMPGAGFANPFAGAFGNPYMPFMMPPAGISGPSTDGTSTLSDILRAAGGFPPTTSAAATSAAAGMPNHAALAAAAAQQVQAGGKRARTRITDEQLKVLRDYFDINNSPTEQQIEEMSQKSGLPQKVIKHWFRNTLFKERQRNKDSPYNFSIPPSLGIDLEEYEKTGEAKIIPLGKTGEDKKENNAAETTDGKKEEERNSEEKLENIQRSVETSELKMEEETKTEPVQEQKLVIKEEKEDPDDASSTAFQQQEALPDPNLRSDLMNALKFSPSQILTAQETLRQLTASMSSAQLPAGFQVGNPFSMLAAAQQQQTLGDSEHTGILGSGCQSSPPSSTNSETMTSLIASAMTPGGALTGPGRRANRTRFSDYQLKELQDFFEKQAYPKDDDLEYLSKKLQLSPRVIVVWFQNARQKARKVYENQPHTDTDRFVKTPGCNFQCKRCNLVFQRYYELIQHQQKQCYKEECEALGAESGSNSKQNSPKFSNKDSDVSSTKSDSGGEFFCDKCAISFSGQIQLEEHLKVHASNPLLFADQDGNNKKRTLAQIMQEAAADGETKRPRSLPRTSESVICMQNSRSRSKERKTGGGSGHQAFNKRCPFCGILFHSKQSMQNHLQTRHADQTLKTTVNIDLLPNAEEVPTITTSAAEMLLKGNSLAQSMLSFGMVAGGGSDVSGSGSGSPVDLIKKLTEGVGGGTPLDLTKPIKINTGTLDSDERSHSASNSGSPNNISFSHSDNEDTQSTFSQDLDSPSPHLQMQGAGGGVGSFPRPPSKRFRTHLSPMQVNIMKHLFVDYKTPSMAECELLGAVIGLHKRVVQVWFQNARAKERKAKTGSGAGGENSRGDLVNLKRCAMCDVAYTPSNSLQDHIFTKEHIEKIRAYLRLQGTEDPPATHPPHPNSNRSSPAAASSNSPRVLAPKSGASTKENSISTSQPATTNESAGLNMNTANAAVAAMAQNFLSPAIAMAAMNPAAYYNNLASSVMYSGLSGLPLGALYDPNIYGTPVNMLQIPASIMQMISSKMKDAKIPSCSFTQDGLNLADLAKAVGNNSKDYRCATEVDLEVQ